MEHELILGFLLVSMIMFSGCTQPTDGQNAVQPQVNNTVQPPAVQPPVNNTESNAVHYISKEAKVTISDASCKIVDLYTGVEAHALAAKGARYAKTYSIQVLGSMSGSENASLSISTYPIVGGEEGLSCGDWDVDNALGTCTRDDSSPETSKWSYHVEAFGEQVAADPDQKITITSKASIGNAEGEAKATVYCPAVDYE
jgi:hypothetical protein